jgi:hypothetical protein
VTGWARRLVELVAGRGVPQGFPGSLESDEHVLAVAELDGGGHLVATSLGLWLPVAEEVRRVGWHLVSKATWSGGALTVTEAEERGSAGSAVLLADLPARRFVLARPGLVPRVVQARVTGSIRSRHHRELPGGGAWFVQRKVPGADGAVLQVRPDPGTDEDAVRRIATEVAARLEEVRRPP